jgi:hypothetical protein
MTIRAWRWRAAFLAVASATSLGGCVYDPYTGHLYLCDQPFEYYCPPYYYNYYYTSPYSYVPYYYAPPPPLPNAWGHPPASATPQGAASPPVTQGPLPLLPPSGSGQPSQ